MPKNKRSKKAKLFHKKHKKIILISGSLVIGIIVALILVFLYGWDNLLKSFLNSLLFATVIIAIITVIKKISKKFDIGVWK